MFNIARNLIRYEPVTKKYLRTIAVKVSPVTNNDQLEETKNVQLTPSPMDSPSNVEREKTVSIYREKPKYTHGIFSYYFRHSGLLQELFRLGVDLHVVEKNPEATQFLLKSQFEDIRDHIIFLKELSLSFEEIGGVITKNPFILRENVEDLKVRINYLEYKKFDGDMIKRIVAGNPDWLSHSTQEIDKCLGAFQKKFDLTGSEVRQLALKRPKLITYPMFKIELNHFALKEEMGFTDEEIKTLILNKPKVLEISRQKLLKSFDYAHNTMKIPLERLIQEPQVLTSREKKLKQRYMFLVKLGKDQFNPLKPNYISLASLVSGTDSVFAVEVAKSSVEIFNNFLKTI